MRITLSALLLTLVACGSDDDTDSIDTDTDVVVDQVPPAVGGQLRDWLEDEPYLGWTGESSVHGSTGPHFGDVRTYVNDALFDSLQAGDTEHPVGAAVVKELYGNGGGVGGHAVMVKVVGGTGGNSWYWFERFEGTTYANDTNDAQCVGCHSAGTDFILTPFPLQ